MKEWQTRQEVYRRLNQIGSDDLNKVDIVWRPDTIVEDALMHWKEEVPDWIYPAKSYFVAICYANWITEDFHEYFDEVLDTPNLLPDDPYFVPYSKDKETYDEILRQLVWLEDEGMVPDVRKYYDEEMNYDRK